MGKTTRIGGRGMRIDAGPGEHVCCLVGSEEEHRAVLTPFLRDGLQRGEKVLYIVNARTAETILKYLRDDGLDVEPHLARGQLVILTGDDAYMQDGIFDPDGMIALLRTETGRALAEGYPALRVSGEMTWALQGLPGSQRLIEYEAKLNAFFPGSRCLAACQYDRRRFDAVLLLDVLRTHPIAAIGTEVYDNFYYLPPADLLGADRAAATLRNWIKNLAQRKRAEEELRRLNQELEADRRAIEELNRSLEAKVRERTRELRQANEELRKRNRQLLDARAQAATDALTGLPNHRAFQERVREDVCRAQEIGCPVGLIMLDIDDFKRVNDSLGHLEGDSILRQLALVLADAARRDDVYRYGGDEFALLLPGGDRRTTARTAERLRRAVARRMHGNPAAVTVSLGVASFPEAAASAEELIYGADAAMYWAKSAGKNRVGDWGRLIRRREDGTLPWYAADRDVKAPDVVAALVAALAAKDPITSAHTERCSWYAARLAEQLALEEEQKSVVRLAALLHDIGKLAVPDEVLCKPGPLNEEEWALMKQHPATALHVLGQIRSIADATPAILHHHEHFDGSGYPDGLAGEEIPIASRILLVSDAFDAMTTDRPYRKAMPVEVAIDELKRNSGSQFDPAVVAAFLRVLSHVGAQPLCRIARDQVGPGPAATPSSRRPGR